MTKKCIERKISTCSVFVVFFRRLAENVGWNVAAVLSMNRESFGPKGPLEASSELLIRHCFRGESQALAKMLQEGFVHPDVADSQGHTALIAATVTLTSFISWFSFSSLIFRMSLEHEMKWHITATDVCKTKVLVYSLYLLSFIVSYIGFVFSSVRSTAIIMWSISCWIWVLILTS